MDKDQYKTDILKSFNEQFAQNQNNHQNLFIQVVSILLTVLVGFGFALVAFGGNKPDSGMKIGILEFSAAFCTAEVMLLLGVSLISSLALGYRRDQLINAIIREKAEVTEDTAKTDKWKVFPASFNPSKRYKEKKRNKERYLFIKWMPNFHSIFTLSFVGFQVLLILIYLFKIFQEHLLFNGESVEIRSIVLGLLGVLSLVASVMVICSFHKYILRYYYK
jgi:hypothetical protein